MVVQGHRWDRKERAWLGHPGKALTAFANFAKKDKIFSQAAIILLLSRENAITKRYHTHPSNINGDGSQGIQRIEMDCP